MIKKNKTKKNEAWGVSSAIMSISSIFMAVNFEDFFVIWFAVLAIICGLMQRKKGQTTWGQTGIILGTLLIITTLVVIYILP